MANITEEKKAELITKANSLIDLIHESIRMIKDIEGVREKVQKAGRLILEIPLENGEYATDASLDEFFDADEIEKIKAYIMNELDFMETGAIKIIDTANFSEKKRIEIPFAPEPGEHWEDMEDDSDMIIIPDKLEKKKGRPGLPDEKVEEIRELAKQGMSPTQIAKTADVSYSSAARYANYESVPNDQVKSGRSVSKL